MQKENDPCSDHFNIIVNAKRHSWKDEIISYVQVINLAFPSTHGPNEIFTVQYSSPKGNCEGTLVKDKEVAVKGGMVFDVTRTDKS